MILQHFHTIWHAEVQFLLFWETRAQQIYGMQSIEGLSLFRFRFHNFDTGPK